MSAVTGWLESIVKWVLGPLDNWSRYRDPSPADSRHIIGAWAAKSVLQYFAVEYLLYLTWSDYDYRFNPISDLGKRYCDSKNDICRPTFVVADLSFLALGVGALVAASLITSTVLRVGGNHADFVREHEKSMLEGTKASALVLVFRHLGGEHYGRKLTKEHHIASAVRISLAVTGLALIGVGSMPEDYLDVGHQWSTGILLVGAVAFLFLLSKLWWKQRPMVARFIGLAAVISATGGILFGTTIAAQAVPRGLFERAVVYGFIAGLTGMGLALSSRAHRSRMPGHANLKQNAARPAVVVSGKIPVTPALGGLTRPNGSKRPHTALAPQVARHRHQTAHTGRRYMASPKAAQGTRGWEMNP